LKGFKMQTNSTPSEKSAVVGVIDPDAYGTGEVFSGYIPLKDFSRFQAIVLAGDLGASATLDAKLVAYTSAAGAGTTDITGAAITQLTQAGTDSNKQSIINLNTDALAGTAFTHIRLSMTVGTATSDAGAVILGFDARYDPASNADATTVDQIVNV
jgi:hypothetical protein